MLKIHLKVIKIKLILTLVNILVDIDRPTYNKLFLFGNDGLDVTTGNTKAAANWGTFKCSTESGVFVIELNTNKGDNDSGKAHGGTGAEILKCANTKVIKSLSMVGPAIPGTTTGNEWDWASTVADMDFDVSENCYKLTKIGIRCFDLSVIINRKSTGLKIVMLISQRWLLNIMMTAHMVSVIPLHLLILMRSLILRMV